MNKVGCEKVGAYSVTVGNWASVSTSESAILSLLGLQMCATLDICGPVSTPYLIEFKTNLNTNWTTLTNITLPAGPFTFIDLGSRGQPQRFYRATPLP
jgi:hypothetical protein